MHRYLIGSSVVFFAASILMLSFVCVTNPLELIVAEYVPGVMPVIRRLPSVAVLPLNTFSPSLSITVMLL